MAYVPINNAINGGKFHLFEAEADKVVNDYIARKQQGKKRGNSRVRVKVALGVEKKYRIRQENTEVGKQVRIISL